MGSCRDAVFFMPVLRNQFAQIGAFLSDPQSLRLGNLHK
jgi:hypothetical protein